MKQEIANVLPAKLRSGLTPEIMAGAEELRLSVGRPLEVRGMDERSVWLGMVTPEMLRECLDYITDYSPYVLESEKKQGFLTIPGGHRVGIVGHVSYHMEDAAVTTDSVDSVSGINIRIARQQRGIAEKIIPYLRKKDKVYHTLIFSPPGVGKTTYLRDVIRLLSDGDRDHRGHKIGVVDERSEIAACYLGIPQNDLGIHTDVLDNCPKVTGMEMLLRSMSPEVIAVDELGTERDFGTMRHMIDCGVTILGTIHANSIREVKSKPYMKEMLSNRNFRFVRLDRDESGRRHVFVYNDEEEGVYVS